MAIDRFGRFIHYLRISLTDRCNLRCIYCMPEDAVFMPREELMQDDEILQLVELFARLGFDKYRLTGGEPTLRAHVVDLVKGITQTPGVKTVTMTTNGLLLHKLAEPMAKAGLKRVNISIDTLNPEKFKRLTRWGKVEGVWKGIQAAVRAGLTPIKLNVVVVYGYNLGDVVDLARLTLEHPWQVRFIEMMPFAGVTGVQLNQLVTSDQIREKIESALGPLENANDGKLDGEAQLYRLPGATGDLGFISSVSQPFCASCTRARLTADGRLRLCLLREGEVDLLTPLRDGASMEELRQLIVEGIWRKPWGHRLAEGQFATDRMMNEIGG
jgi:cyclic pyranopterin phosphate synthase